MNHSTLPLPYAADLELLQMVTSTLMTRFYAQSCPGIARAVVRHLEELLKHPRIRASLAAGEGYAVLLQEWKLILERSREALAEQKATEEQARAGQAVH